jgi:hypothetical protein
LLLLLLLGLLAAGPASAQDTLPPGCQELLGNGSFESDGGWLLAVTSWPGQLVDAAAHSGQRSAFVGLAPEEANVASHSIVQQSFTLPAAAEVSRLTLWLQPTGTASGEDRHYVLLQNPDGQIASILLFTILDGAEWQEQSFDLAGFAGQELILQIGVANDGLDGSAAMFIDDVSIISCAAEPVATDTPEPTPTPTETAAPTALPTATPEPSPPPAIPPVAGGTPAPAETPTTPAPPPTPTPTAPAQTVAAPATPTATVPPFDAAGAPAGPMPVLNSQAGPVLVGVLASSVVILSALAFSRRRNRS